MLFYFVLCPCITFTIIKEHVKNIPKLKCAKMELKLRIYISRKIFDALLLFAT